MCLSQCICGDMTLCVCAYWSALVCYALDGYASDGFAYTTMKTLFQIHSRECKMKRSSKIFIWLTYFLTVQWTFLLDSFYGLRWTNDSNGISINWNSDNDNMILGVVVLLRDTWIFINSLDLIDWFNLMLVHLMVYVLISWIAQDQMGNYDQKKSWKVV